MVRRFHWLGQLTLKRLLLAIVILYLLGLALACIFPDRFVLFPSQNPIHIANISRRIVESPTGPLEIWTTQTPAARSSGPAGFVLAFNGNGSRAERELGRIEPMWSGHPVEIWAVNYPGYGGSAGGALLKNIPPAALAAYDALAAHAAGKPIFISGHSLGTTAALYVAANRPVAGVVLHNPPPLRQLIWGRFGWFNFWIAAGRVAAAVPPELDSLANGAKCHVPAVFLRAGKDTLVTPPYQKMVVDAYAGPKRIVHLPTYSHNTPVIDSPELARVRPQIDWLWNQAMPIAPKK